MKVIVKGAYGTRNFGDDLLMLSMFDILKPIKCEVDFLCPDHSYIYRLNPSMNLNSNNSNRNYDICIFGGGTQFFHFKVSALNKRHNVLYKVLGNLLNIKRLKNSVFRKINGSVTANKEVFLGIGLGPFEDSEIKRAMLSNISNSDFVSLRDKQSIEYLSEFKRDIHYGADLCFTPEFKSYLKINSLKEKSMKKNVGIILRDWNNTKEGVVSEKTISSVVREILKKNDNYIFIFFSAVHDVNWIKYCKINNYEFVVWDPDTQNVSDLMGKLSNCDVIVSSRFHGLVVSSLLRIPFVSLAIEPKLSLFSNKFEGFRTVSYPFSSNEILEGISVASWEGCHTKVVSEEERRAANMINVFQEYLKGKFNGL